jgi:hypothetical protein
MQLCTILKPNIVTHAGPKTLCPLKGPVKEITIVVF